jgi:hypothetical protein
VSTSGPFEGNVNELGHRLSRDKGQRLSYLARKTGGHVQPGQYLLGHFDVDYGYHERPSDALYPRDVWGLYEKYRYRAHRLYELWRAAGDPTPVTRIERWTEARRNPRFIYWCAVVSIIAAMAFGMLATAIAAVQVWISSCGWVVRPSIAQCRYEKHGDKSGR